MNEPLLYITIGVTIGFAVYITTQWIVRRVLKGRMGWMENQVRKKMAGIPNIQGLELIPIAALEAIAGSFEFGLIKYNCNRDGWKKCTLDEVQDKIDRHLSALYDGIEYDSEGNSHLGAVLADVAIYGELLRIKREGGKVYVGSNNQRR